MYKKSPGILQPNSFGKKLRIEGSRKFNPPPAVILINHSIIIEIDTIVNWPRHHLLLIRTKLLIRSQHDV